MLTHLTIDNFVLIHHISVDFSDHFNVFTGETGAGKSLLVDALNFVSGQRSSASVVGKNGKSARVEVAFNLEKAQNLTNKLKDFDLYDDADEYAVISREMNLEGRSICRINHRVVNLSTVKSCLDGVLDIHSQHETQYLLNPKNHLKLLDEFAQNETVRSQYQELFHLYQATEARLNNLENSNINPDEIEFGNFQLNEINDLNPSLDDYHQTKQDLEMLSNFEKTKTFTNALEDILDGDEGVVGKLYEFLDRIDVLRDETLQERFKHVYFEAEDLRDELVRYNSGLVFDEYEFNRLQDRVYQYDQLIRKYGSIDGVLKKQEALIQQIEQAEHFDDFKIDLENELRAVQLQLSEAAQYLSQSRFKAKADLEAAVIAQLDDLLLENAQFVIDLKNSSLTLDGAETAHFLVSMNKGIQPSPLERVASGGELSRLMLGLKTIFSSIYGVSTLIFDEIDTGVSGRVALKIGSKMSKISQTSQVLTISHLAAVAACADHHFLISKNEVNDEIVTDIQEITEDDRIHQMALIMSGNVTEAALYSAKELLKEGQHLRWHK
ncbi:DNA repair protein RecN [Erysipelothrix piscisicarius]|uniref:DNA repair protein RecN n=1 Tax=Erysipelothrix piscisicarius TaxID=2485784 RepID=A0A3Q8S2V4_9FIRM|nr:DNA repair protein RecN [Erysipelothrix piscisicarius]AZK44316.1 DNA repair protein RecN [Erysipelothrix piscisicarius]